MMISPKQRNWILGLSLLGNAFSLGVFITFPPPQMGPPDPIIVSDFVSKRLPVKDGEIFRQTFASRANEIAAARKALLDMPEQLSVVLKTEPFNQDEFGRILKHGDDAMAASLEIVSSALQESVPKLSSEGRRMLADLKPPRK